MEWTRELNRVARMTADEGILGEEEDLNRGLSRPKARVASFEERHKRYDLVEIRFLHPSSKGSRP